MSEAERDTPAGAVAVNLFDAHANLFACQLLALQPVNGLAGTRLNCTRAARSLR